jgi:uncharacterized iron-regulated membrane protein
VPQGQTQGAAATWRVQLRAAGSDGIATVLIDDQSGKVTTPPAALPGDRVAQWIRWIHEGSHSGPVWQTIVYMCGVFPPIFAVTGVIMWLRRRPDAKRAKGSRRAAARLRPAE